MKECIRGIADLCGAKLVDTAFESLLKLRFGNLWDIMSVDTRQALIKEHWEDSLKRRFSARRQEMRAIRVPYEVVDEASRMKITAPKAITLTTQEIEGVFQPAFDRAGGGGAGRGGGGRREGRPGPGGRGK